MCLAGALPYEDSELRQDFVPSELHGSGENRDSFPPDPDAEAAGTALGRGLSPALRPTLPPNLTADKTRTL